MLSRVADHLYWMSRYLERAEHTARLLDVSLNLTLEQSPDAAQKRWKQMFTALHVEQCEGSSPYAYTQCFTFDPGNANAIVNCIAAARDNAQHVRELISTEMWESLNTLYWQVKQTTIDDIWHGRPHEFFVGVREGAHLFQGITDSTMIQGEGWHFIQVGRWIERASSVAALVDVHFADMDDWRGERGATADFLEWVGLLKSCTAFEAYLKVYTADVRPDHVAEFLLLNPDFPHSVCFAVTHLQAALNAIADLTETHRAGRLTKLAGRLRALVEFSHVDDLIGGDLHGTLEQIQTLCGQIHTVLYQTYITYAIEREFMA